MPEGWKAVWKKLSEEATRAGLKWPTQAQALLSELKTACEAMEAERDEAMQALNTERRSGPFQRDLLWKPRAR